MAILNLKFNRKMVMSIEDYGDIFKSVLNLDVSFTIIQYSLTEQGVIMRISVPDDKLRDVMESLKTHNIRIMNSTISVNDDLCVHCGECISLCNADALHFDKELKRCFDEKKCIGCKICVDACPRKALSFD
jgi:L-aspartate semialdehyde sulfurtransferase ferredoxin